MQVRAQEIKELKELLYSMQSYGWVAFPTQTEPVRTEEFVFFNNKTETLQFCNQAQHAYLLVDILLREIVDLEMHQSVLSVHHGVIEVDEEVLLVINDDRLIAREKAEVLAERLKDWGHADDITSYFEPFLYGDCEQFHIQFTENNGNRNEYFCLNIDCALNGSPYISSVVYEALKEINITGVYVAGVYSLDLEQQMQKINWHALEQDLQNNAFGENLQRALQHIQHQMEQLSATHPGKLAVEELQAKYWIGTFMESAISDPIYVKTKYLLQQEFFASEYSFSKREIQNLMHGRFVCKDLIQNGIPVQPWFYRFGATCLKRATIERVGGSECLDLRSKIEELQRSGYQFDKSSQEMMKEFKQGDALPAKLHSKNGIYECKIYVDALSQNLFAKLERQFYKVDMHLQNSKRKSL